MVYDIMGTAKEEGMTETRKSPRTEEFGTFIRIGRDDPLMRREARELLTKNQRATERELGEWSCAQGKNSWIEFGEMKFIEKEATRDIPGFSDGLATIGYKFSATGRSFMLDRLKLPKKKATHSMKSSVPKRKRGKPVLSCNRRTRLLKTVYANT